MYIGLVVLGNGCITPHKGETIEDVKTKMARYINTNSQLVYGNGAKLLIIEMLFMQVVEVAEIPVTVSNLVWRKPGF